ncbi:MAG TPA: MBL fold metallo-hydrolase, partial [Streptosporangiaceae bacterium]
AQLLWATVDSPWVHAVDPAKYAASFQPLRDFGPSAIFSTHLPPVSGDSTALFTTLLDAPQAGPFTGPDQAALEAMLNQFQPA